MKRQFLILVVFALFMGCTSETESPDIHLAPPEKKFTIQQFREGFVKFPTTNDSITRAVDTYMLRDSAWSIIAFSLQPDTVYRNIDTNIRFRGRIAERLPIQKNFDGFLTWMDEIYEADATK